MRASIYFSTERKAYAFIFFVSMKKVSKFFFNRKKMQAVKLHAEKFNRGQKSTLYFPIVTVPNKDMLLESY